MAISDDRFLPGLAAPAARVHRHGARLAAQLVHMGASSTPAFW
jgi:2,4-dienoyl-CoA reductase-like NADH-dependent reductase (Old Yellow Enzyme family)